jgi:hypothetical protein
LFRERTTGWCALFITSVIFPAIAYRNKLQLTSGSLLHRRERTMNVRFRLATIALLISCCLPAYAHHVAVVVAPENHVNNLTTPELARILKTETRKWETGRSVMIVLSRQTPASLEILERLCKLPKGSAKAFIAAHKDSVALANTDEDVMFIVQGTPGALGMVDVRDVSGRVKVLRVDGKLPLEQGYLPH